MPSAGRAARKAGAIFLFLGIVAGVLALVLAHHDADLRALDSLVRTSAQVADRDSGGKGPDYLEVRFAPAGASSVEARIPSSSSARRGDEVDVAYVAADPSRVRTVADWSPAWQRSAIFAIAFGALGVLLGGFGLVSLARHGRFEADAPLPLAVVDPGLGRRLARSGRSVQATFAVVGVAAFLGCLVIGLTTAEAVPTMALVGGVFLVLMLAFAAFYHWYQGRDGLWENDTGLVAHRRGRERRWSWDEVRELGTVGGSAGVQPAAKLAHERVHGWVVLAKPILGPVAALQAARRIEAVAAEHGLPYTEGLSGADLAE